MRSFLAILVAFLAPIAATQAQEQPIPRLEQRVVDFTNTLSFAEWKSLEGELKAFEDSTSNQVVLLLVATTGGTSIEEYATKVFEQNGIGQKDKNNGVLLVVALDDQTVRIEVGYGLEGVLTDAVCRKIIEQEVKPRFRDGQYYAGLVGAVYAIAGAVAGEYTADGSGQAAPALGGSLFIVAFLIFVFIIRPLLMSRRRTSVWGGGNRYYSGWGWPGSFGGGGGGGFGGFSGGGGLSGGGGATGRW